MQKRGKLEVMGFLNTALLPLLLGPKFHSAATARSKPACWLYIAQATQAEVKVGLYWGYMGIMENKENGNYYNGFRVWVGYCPHSVGCWNRFST